MSKLEDRNLNEIGKYTATIKITSIEPASSGRAGFMGIEGCRKKLKYITSRSDKFAKKLEVGAEAEAEIEVVEDEYPAGSGQKQIIAFIRSFGGANQQQVRGGGGSGRAFTPKSDAEIHSASIAGIVKSCLEQVEVHEFNAVFDMALEAYCRGIDRIVSGKAKAAMASPQIQAAETNWLELDRELNNAEAREGSEYWKSIGGTPEAFADIRRLCPRIHAAKLFLEAKRQWLQDPLEVIRLVLPSYGRIPGSGIAEPGDHRSGTRAIQDEAEPRNFRELFHDICDSRNWPTFALAPDACKTVYSRVLGRQVRNATHLTDHDYHTLYEWAMKVAAEEEEEPMSFRARAKEAASA